MNMSPLRSMHSRDNSSTFNIKYNNNEYFSVNTGNDS